MPVAEEREEAGTPNTLGCVRAGLAFALKVLHHHHRRRVLSVTAATGAHRAAVHCCTRSGCLRSCARSAAASLHTTDQAKIKREVVILRAV